jgi:hypothetical protein
MRPPSSVAATRLCSISAWTIDVRLGSNSEVSLLSWQVRCTLKGGHRQAALEGRFRATTGLMHRSIQRKQISLAF